MISFLSRVLPNFPGSKAQLESLAILKVKFDNDGPQQGKKGLPFFCPQEVLFTKEICKFLQTLDLYPKGYYFFFFFFLVFIYFWPHWVFVALGRLYLVATHWLLIVVISLVVEHRF